MIRAVAFDFDGVLVETVEVKTRAFARLFQDEGPEVVRHVVDYHRRHGGVSRFEKFRTIYRAILRRPLSDATFRRLCEEFASLVVAEVTSAPWVEGAEEFLRRHHERYRLVVVSGTPQEELGAILRARGAERFFSAVLGSPRTKDVLLREVLSQSRLAPAELAFVGDSETDWQAAAAVGVPFILRRTESDPAACAGFSGARIGSLRGLEAVLARVTREAVVTGCCG